MTVQMMEFVNYNNKYPSINFKDCLTILFAVILTYYFRLCEIAYLILINLKNVRGVMGLVRQFMKTVVNVGSIKLI